MTSASLSLRALAGDLLEPVTRRRAAARSGVLVFCVHGVDDVFEPDAYRSSHLELAAFEQVIDELTQVFRFVSLDEALDGVAGGDGRPSAAMTFDDGYLDQFTHAAAALKRRGIPATYYVTSARVADGQLLWFDRVRLALAGGAAAAGTVLGRHGVTFDGAAMDELRSMPRVALRALLGDLAASGAEPRLPPRSHLRTVRAADLREFAADPLVTIGSHGAEHLDLLAQEDAVRREEVAGSRRDLESALGVPVRHFAYPYGAHDASLAALVREAGYVSAATTERAWWQTAMDPFRVPRLILGIGRSGYAFYKAATLP